MIVDKRNLPHLQRSCLDILINLSSDDKETLCTNKHQNIYEVR